MVGGLIAMIAKHAQKKIVVGFVEKHFNKPAES